MATPQDPTPPSVASALSFLLASCKKVGEGQYRFASTATAQILALLRPLPKDVQRHELKMLMGAAAFFMAERNAPEAGFFVIGLHSEVSAALGFVGADPEPADDDAPAAAFSFCAPSPASKLLGTAPALPQPAATPAPRLSALALRDWAPAAGSAPPARAVVSDDTNPQTFFADRSAATI